MNGIFKNEPEQLEKSTISLTTCSSPLYHISNYIEQTTLALPDIQYQDGNADENNDERQTKHNRNFKESENEENCIKFILNEFEDFYLQNVPSPEFTDTGHFTFSKHTANVYYNDDEKVLDLELFNYVGNNEMIVRECTPTPSCETPLEFINNIDFINDMHCHSLNYPSHTYPYKLQAVKPNYAAMDISNILKLKLSIRELTRHNLVHRLMKDQIGSRYLQNIIKSADSRNNVKKMISALINNLISNNIDLTVMSEDIYGNYLIQLFFIYGNDLHHEVLFNYFVYKSILSLSKSKYGCRVVQKILSAVKNTSKLVLLIECFQQQAMVSGKNKINECLLCCNSNHVIQAMIELKLPFKTMRFIADELENNLVSYSENVYACRVVQAFIRNYGDKLNVNKLFINDNHLFLSQVKYGNYVIQCIIEKNQWYSNLSLINKFRNQFINDVFNKGNILYLSKDKHGSNVIETCIKVANGKQMDNLINTICAKKGFLLKQIISDRFGNYVPKTLLENSNKKQQKILVNTTHKYITNLYNHYHEYRQCAKYIQICQQIKYQMDATC